MKLFTIAAALSLVALVGCSQSTEEPAGTSDSALLDEGNDPPAPGGTLDAACFDACAKAKWGTARQCENKCTN